MELSAIQKENLSFFKTKLPSLLADKLTASKFVVIHGNQVQHVADSFDNALKFAISHFPPNEFIVQQVIDEASTISFLYFAV